MAGLFELQLPNESNRRRSNNHLVTPLGRNSARSASPIPGDTAKAIVNQLMEKQKNGTIAGSSSIFPWRRKPTGTASAPSPQSSDEATRRSRDSASQPARSPYSKSIGSSWKGTQSKSSLAPASPRQSLSTDLTVPSVQPVALASGDEGEDSQRATIALAQAALGLSIPPIALPESPLPISKRPGRPKRTDRPGTANGSGSASVPQSPISSGSMRRAKSFSKLPVEDTSQQSTIKKNGDILVFSRDPTTASFPHAQSMPVRFSHALDSQKGKKREQLSDAELRSSEKGGSPRGRQIQSAVSPLSNGDRDKSATRRLSWWPGRRRVDSTPGGPGPGLPISPPTSPPPIPMRSQDRPPPPSKSPPSLPTFRPFSPLMNDFRITDSPKAKMSFDGHNTVSGRHGLTDSISSLGQSLSSPIHRRHSLNSRSANVQTTVATSVAARPLSNQSSSRPSSQVSSYLHKNSQLPEHVSLESDSMPFTEPPGLSKLHFDPAATTKRPRSAAGGITSPFISRPRSMTLNSQRVVLTSNDPHDTPLLLRRPVNHSNTSEGASDTLFPRTCTRERPSSQEELPTLPTDPVDSEPTPSTSTGSMSSFSQSGHPGNSSRQHSGSKTLVGRPASGNPPSSLPPPTSANHLFRRLSWTLFSSSTPASPSDSIPTELAEPANFSGALVPARRSPGSSDMSSFGQSKESLSAAEASRSSIEVLKGKPLKVTRLPEESPEHFLSRLVECTSRAEVAHVLASSGEEFYSQALNLYLSQFKFANDPLDVALRRLLMEIGLPRETQQIDRVMEAFAVRYMTCNSNLFVDKDHPYILAFSLIMLHTDAFNKSNKNKMTKADYVKNTKIPSVPPEILECFFDNIVFAPFIFIEDPMEAHPVAKNYLPEGSSRVSSVSGSLTNSPGGVNAGSSTLLGKANKIDPYYLITQNLLGPLRADVETHIPKSNPFLYEGTDWPWDTQRLHHSFALAQVLYVRPDISVPVTPITGTQSGHPTAGRRKSIAMPPMYMTHGSFMSAPLPLALDIPLARLPAVAALPVQGSKTLKIAKAGVLMRKDDTIEGGKRSPNRKWREWSVVLTNTQLLFFRDVNFATHLLDLSSTTGTQQPDADVALLNPDDVTYLYECIAVYDTSYTKYPHAFRFITPNGRQFIMKTSNEQNLNDWISVINYASAFASAGVGMRGLGMSQKEVEMTGVAAATSHLKDLMSTGASTTLKIHSNNNDTLISNANTDVPWLSSTEFSPRHGSASKLLRSFDIKPNQVNLEVPLPSQVKDSRQFKATFEEVKAELAAQTSGLSQSRRPVRSRTFSMRAQPISSPKKNARPNTADSATQSEDFSPPVSPLPRSRADVIQTRVDLLDARIKRLERELNEELRIARNLAILTPFQRATRDRVQLAVAPLAKKIRSMRIDLAKCQCYRFVLLSDMAEEENQWEKVKREALHVATRRLSVAEPQLGPRLDIPSDPMPIHGEPSTSTTASFHTATDMNYIDSLSPRTASYDSHSHKPSKLQTNLILDLLTPTQSPMTSLFDGSSPVVDGHERFYTAMESSEEIAEEWNETRAAKRVSLVRVPSHVKLSILGRQLRSGNDLGSGSSL